jgi:hypothetical protein
MKNHEEQLAAIQEMRNMMDQATRFKSISGLSGMIAGLLSLLSLYMVYLQTGISPFEAEALERIWHGSNQIQISCIFIALLVACLGLGLYMARRNARQAGKNVWDGSAKRLSLSLLIPVLVGGIFSVLLIRLGLVALLAPVTLLFYGMGLLSASKYTLEAIRTVGLIITGLGLLATGFLSYGLLIWALGFGLVHILYGFIIYIRYERV